MAHPTRYYVELRNYSGTTVGAGVTAYSLFTLYSEPNGACIGRVNLVPNVESFDETGRPRLYRVPQARQCSHPELRTPANFHLDQARASVREELKEQPRA